MVELYVSGWAAGIGIRRAVIDNVEKQIKNSGLSSTNKERHNRLTLDETSSLTLAQTWPIILIC